MKKDIEIKSLFYNEWDLLPENVRKMYEDAKYLHNLYPHINNWDWFMLVGFIHDLGKVLACKEFGELP
jgi:inositol oxygenase